MNKVCYILIPLLSIWFSSPVISQQTPYYSAAATAYRNAANQTPCLTTKQWYLQKASWCDCMVSSLENWKKCPEITTPEPPCNETVNGNSNLGNAGNNSSPSKNAYQRTEEGIMASNSALNAYTNAINNGRKKSGASLDATLAAARNFTDAGAVKTTLAIGGLLSLINFIGEMKEEKLQKQREAKKYATNLFSQDNEVLIFWRDADFSHKTGTLRVVRNKKGYIKGMEFTKGTKKFYDYLVIENSADSVRLVVVEQYSLDDKKINSTINVIQEYRFSIHDIKYCTFEEQREDFSFISGDEKVVNYINELDTKAIANILSEGTGNIDWAASLPTGIYTLRLGVSYKNRRLECLPTHLNDAFDTFLNMPFNTIQASGWNPLEFYFDEKSEGEKVYNILKVFAY